MEINIKPTRMATSFKTEKIYPQLEELNVTPSTEEQVIEGAFNKVTVKAIETEDLVVIPTAEEQTFNGLFGNVTVEASSGGIDTSDATATAEDIAKDKTAYVNGEKITGTSESNGYNVMIDITGVTEITGSNGILEYTIKVDDLDFSHVTSTGYLFRGWVGLKEAPMLDTSNVLYLGYMFMGCSNLETVHVYDVTNLKHMNGAFQGCTNLSDESLNNIMQMCINAKNYSLTKTLKAIGLTSAQATTCQSLSNYQAFLDAGWVTGY